MEIDTHILDSLEQHRQQAIAWAGEEYEKTLQLFRLCESPLEQSLLHELILLTNAYPCDYQLPHLLTQCYGEPFYLGFSLRIYPQYELTLPYPERGSFGTTQKAFRPDFLLLLIPPEDVRSLDYPRDFLAGAFAKVVVEIDGHDYHERTKEQAENDKSRDRAFTNSGFTVLRFTGREIYREVQNKALEILTCLNSACTRFIDDKSLRFFPDHQ